MRVRKQPLGTRNIAGARVEMRRKEIGMKQKDLLTRLQVRGIDLNASGLSKLEGQFRSMWRNRLSPEMAEEDAIGFREVSKETKMIVLAAGDMIKNRYDGEHGVIYPTGYDSYTRTLYANKELLLNAVNYLVGDEGLMDSRSRSITLRKLDEAKVRNHRTLYQTVNIVVPLLLLAAAGIVITMVRKRRFRA